MSRRRRSRSAQVCDILQVPAFLRAADRFDRSGCRGAAKHGRVVNVKKPQFTCAGRHGARREKMCGVRRSGVLLCERGTMFGYGRLINDMRRFGDAVARRAGHLRCDP